MFPFIDVGMAIIKNIKFLLINPFIYVVILMIILQYRRMINNERALYSVRINSITELTISSIGYGVIGGLFATALLLIIGVVLNPYDMIYVWIVAIAVALINIRYLCFSYAAGILGILAFLAAMLPQMVSWPFIGNVWAGLAKLNVPMLIALVAILHLTESLLIWLHGDKQASPVYISCKRGQLVGGFSMQKFWFVPLFIIVAIDPVALGGLTESVSGENTISLPEWWPLLPLSQISGLVLGMLPIPAVLGYGDIAISRTPRKKAKETAKYLALYSVVLLGLALLSGYSLWLLLVAAIFAAGAHEAIIIFGKRKEILDTPLYSKPESGVRILHIIPDSTAARLGLKTGEIIYKVNGLIVNDQLEMHAALSLQPYLRLEVFNIDGDLKFVNTPMYHGEHHSLGVILGPDERTRRYMLLNADNPFKRWWRKFIGGK